MPGCGGIEDARNLWLVIATAGCGSLVLWLYAVLAIRGAPPWLWGAFNPHKHVFAAVATVTAVSFLGLVLDTALNTTVTVTFVGSVVIFFAGAIGWAAVAATARGPRVIPPLRFAVAVTAAGSAGILVATIAGTSECAPRHPLAITAAAVVAAHHTVVDGYWAYALEAPGQHRLGALM